MTLLRRLRQTETARDGAVREGLTTYFLKLLELLPRNLEQRATPSTSGAGAFSF